MKQLLYKYAGLFLIMPLFAGCMKEPVYPKEPQIEFKSITSNQKGKGVNAVANVEIVIKFKDGDGNLGFGNTANDTLPPFNFTGTNKYHYNIIVDPFIEINNKFEPFKVLIPYHGRFPKLNPDEQTRTLEGELKYSLPPIFVGFFPANFKSGNKMKFRVNIIDKALNESNIIETEPITIVF